MRVNARLVVLALLMGLFLPRTTQAIEWASDLQREAFHYGPAPLCLSGGWGSGKTWLGCLKILYLCDTYPRNRVVIARRVGKELRATTRATFQKVCPPAAYDPKYGGRNNEELTRLTNGSEILWLHLESPETQTIIKGLEVNAFFIDQAEEEPEMLEEVFDLLLGRVGRWDQAEVPAHILAEHAATGRPWPFFNPRTGAPQPPPYAILACNPDIEMHWIYRRFHPESPERLEPRLPELDVATRKPTGNLLSFADLGYRMVDMPSTTNKFLTDVNLQYLLAHDDAFVSRNVDGVWGLPAGAIHTVSPLSLIEGTPELLDWIRASCTLHRRLDHGDSAPTCCLWGAVSKEGDVYIYREYYLPNALISTHRANIAALSEGERYDTDKADPSIFNKIAQKNGGRYSVADEYRDTFEQPEHTALFWHPADNNELGTRNRLNEYLRVDPTRVHPITRQRGSPRLFFVKANDSYPQGCLHVLRETKSQRRVKLGTELGRPIFTDERDESVSDHAYDPLRYLIASRPPVPSAQNPRADPKTFFGAQQQLVEWQKRLMKRRR